MERYSKFEELPVNMLWNIRKIGASLALAILLLFAFTYQDYPSINHQMLQDIVEKLEQNNKSYEHHRKSISPE